MVNLFITLLPGAAVGLLLGLTGAGGGIFAIPALTLLLGYGFLDARPISLLAIAIAATLGVLQAIRSGQVRWRAAIFIAFVGALISPLGSWLAYNLRPTIVHVSFYVLMLFLASKLILKAWTTSTSLLSHSPQARPCMLNQSTGRLFWTGKCAFNLAIVGASTGLFSGLYGVGGGFVLVPGLIMTTNISMHATTATSLMVIALVSSMSAITMAIQGVSISESGWLFLLALVCGTLLGRKLTPFIAPLLVQFGLGILMLITAILFAVFI